MSPLLAGPTQIQLAAEAGSALFYGAGNDGSVVFDGSTTILGYVPVANVYTVDRDLTLVNCTINSGVRVEMAGYRLFCRGTLTNNGTVSNTTNDGADGAAGGAGGDHGKGFTLPCSTVTGGNGSNSGAGNNGGNTSASLGGRGGNGGAGFAGAGGTAGTNTAPVVGGAVPFDGNLYAIPTMFTGTGRSGSFLRSGSGGGGAAGDDVSVTFGGGGGGPAGSLGIYAKYIAGAGSITCKGGDGGDGDPSGSAARGTGGGGGGGGGYVVIVSSSASSGGVPGQTVNVDGGAGGAKFGTSGVAGSAGNPGQIFYIPD